MLRKRGSWELVQLEKVLVAEKERVGCCGRDAMDREKEESKQTNLPLPIKALTRPCHRGGSSAENEVGDEVDSEVDSKGSNGVGGWEISVVLRSWAEMFRERPRRVKVHYPRPPNPLSPLDDSH